MKNFINCSDGYITIETSIVMVVIITVITYSLSLLLNEFTYVSNYCTEMSERSNNFSNEKSGNILRIVKVISETGGRIIDEIFEKHQK